LRQGVKIILLERVHQAEIPFGSNGDKIRETTSDASNGLAASMTVMLACASPFVTEAGLPFGEIAQCFGEWQLCFGRANVGRRKGFWCGRAGRASPKVFAPGGHGQPAFAGDGRLLSNRDETWLPEYSGKLGGAVCRSVARVFWGESVFRLTGLSVG
jgi:hypothetical protein